MTYDPYSVLRDNPGLTVVWDVNMPQRGRWYDALKTMLIRKGQGQAEKRCAVAHEVVHMERGDDDGCDWRVHREAARRLIDIRALADAALYYEDDLEALAEHLWVDLDTLTTRLQHLHPAERGYLTRRLSTKERTA